MANGLRRPSSVSRRRQYALHWLHTIRSSNSRTCRPHMQMQRRPNINNNFNNICGKRSRDQIIGLDGEIVKWLRLTIRRRTQVYPCNVDSSMSRASCLLQTNKRTTIQKATHRIFCVQLKFYFSFLFPFTYSGRGPTARGQCTYQTYRSFAYWCHFLWIDDKQIKN